MKRIYFATGNPGKLEEVQDFLEIPLEIANLDLEEVQSMNLEYVVKRKASEAYRILKKPVIVDDVGVFFEAWKGFPGPLIKFLFLHLGNKKIVELIKNEKNRKVSVQSAVGYHDGKKIHIFMGVVKCTIAFEEKGTDGWGLDPILIPIGKTQTFAEMGFKEKNKISHRRRAFDEFKKFLDSQGRKKKV